MAKGKPASKGTASGARAPGATVARTVESTPASLVDFLAGAASLGDAKPVAAPPAKRAKLGAPDSDADDASDASSDGGSASDSEDERYAMMEYLQRGTTEWLADYHTTDEDDDGEFEDDQEDEGDDDDEMSDGSHADPPAPLSGGAASKKQKAAAAPAPALPAPAKGKEAAAPAKGKEAAAPAKGKEAAAPAKGKEAAAPPAKPKSTGTAALQAAPTAALDASALKHQVLVVKERADAPVTAASKAALAAKRSDAPLAGTKRPREEEEAAPAPAPARVPAPAAGPKAAVTAFVPSATPAHCVFVAGLPEAPSSAALSQALASFGAVKTAHIEVKNAGKLARFGYVEFATPDAAAAAVKAGVAGEGIKVLPYSAEVNYRNPDGSRRKVNKKKEARRAAAAAAAAGEGGRDGARDGGDGSDGSDDEGAARPRSSGGFSRGGGGGGGFRGSFSHGGGGFRGGPPRGGGSFRGGPPREGGSFRGGPPRGGGGFRGGPPRGAAGAHS